MHIDNKHPLSRYVQVSLDGQKLSDCMEADDVRGRVVRINKRALPGELKTFEEFGVVVIEALPPAVRKGDTISLQGR